MTQQTTQTQWKLGQLDALRGIAILGVMLVHSLAAAPFPIHAWWVIEQMLLSGQRGVQLFFIVSAFTLALSHDRRKAERRPLLNFTLRRFFRIAPMFYVGVVLARLWRPDLSGPWTHCLLSMSFLSGFRYDTINQGAIGGWSVADEAIFYACLPLLLLLVKSIRTAAITFLIAACTLIPLASFLWRNSPPAQQSFYLFFSMIAELPVFLIGLMTYHVWKLIRSRPEEQRKGISILCGSVAIVLYITLLPFSYDQLLPESGMLALVVLCLVLHPWPAIVNRATILLGKISFSVYLLHSLVFLQIGIWLHQHYPLLRDNKLAALIFALGVPCSLPLALLSWHVIERPGIRLGSWVIARLNAEESPDGDVPPLGSLKDTASAQF